MKRLRYGISLCLAAWTACQAMAQEMRGTIFGRVLDSSGAAIPGARVTAIQMETNIRVEAVTNMEGNYVLPYLNQGRYSLVVAKEGFASIRRENIELRTQERLSIDITLNPGQLTETVTVTAQSPLVQTASADFGQVISTSFINRLPVVGTNPLGLADMAPGVVPANPDASMSDHGASRIAINGSLGPGGTAGTGNQLTIDGAPADVPRQAGVSYVIPMHEMVSEIKVVTAMFDASLGRTNGGSILVATRSGTNEYHGSAYYHFRDERFNANSWTNNYFGRPKGQINYWLAGGTLGGPIRRNRSFVMLGIEKVRDLGSPNYRLRVPTARERRGDFSETLDNQLRPLQLYDPLTTVLDSRGNFVSRQPFPGGLLPPDRINPVGEAVAKLNPEPNYTVFPNQLGQVNYLTATTARYPILLWQTRVDHMLSSRHRLYFRYGRNSSWVSVYDSLPVRGYAGYGNTQDGNTDHRLSNQFTVEETFTVRPTLVSSFRLSFNRYDGKTKGDGDRQDPDALKLPDIIKNNLYTRGWPRFRITDGPIPSVGPLYRRSVNNVGSFSATFNGYRGNHNVRWGWEYRLTRWNEDQPGTDINSEFYFAKALTRANDSSASEPYSGSGLASLLLGLPTSGSIGRNPAMASQNHHHAFYVQDDYRLTQKLTLSWGLRYDLETPLTDRYDRFSFGFDPQADLGITVPGVGPLKGGLLFVNDGGLPRTQGWTDKNNFGPRLGAAYTLTPKTVLRFGWGLFYQGLVNNIGPQTSSFPSAPGTYRFVTPYIGSGDDNRTVIPGVNLSNPFPNGFNPVTGKSEGVRSLLGRAVSFAKPDRAVPSTHHIQFTIQRELPWTSVAEVAYVGARYNSLYRTYNLNDVPDAYRRQDQSVPNPFFGILSPATGRGGSPTITANQLQVRFPHFTSVEQTLTNGPWARYHSLQSRWEKRMTHGVQFVANYTFSKNMYFDVQSLVNDRFYKSVTAGDRTHIARLFLTADLPFGRTRAWGATWPSWLDRIAGGWGFTWVMRYTSGAPLGLSGPIGRPFPLANPRTDVPFRNCLGTPAGARPDTPCLDISKVQPLLDRYDISSEPPRYSWLRGPGYLDKDAVLFKTFNFMERLSFELRAEANNITNTPQWGNPGTNISDPRTFGQITGGGNPRTVRLTGRLAF